MTSDPSIHSVDEQKALDASNAMHAEEATLTKAEREQYKTISQLGQHKAKQKLSMRVKVYSPFQDYFDGQAFSLSAENLTGPFDILPKHHNFITLLSPCDLVVRTSAEGSQEPTRISISGGILHVKADEVIVFLDV